MSQTSVLTQTKSSVSTAAAAATNNRIISAAELAEHAQLDNANSSLWTSIDGVVYDITSFLRSGHHPGGPVIRLSAGRDATCLIESYHPQDSLKKIQSTLANKCNKIGLLDNYNRADDKFFVAVRDRVEKHLANINMDRHYIQWISLGEAAITVMLYLIISVYVGLYRSYLGAIVLGILTGRLGFLMHTGNHCGASHSIIVNRILGYFMDLIGSTNVIWSYEHQVAHHMDPNEEGKDNDCQIGNPFFRMHPKLPWHPLQQFQHITVPIAISIGFIKWYLSDFGHYLSGKVGNVALPTTTHDWAILFLFKAFWFLLHAALPWYYHGLGHALALSILFMVVGAHYLENVFIVNHIQHGLVPPSNAHWAVKQVIATSNWQSRSHFWNFISGGLNHQIEHHLFPSVSTWLYPFISPIVETTCKEYGLPYFNYNGFSEAWWDMNNYLKAMGQKDFIPEKYNSLLVKNMKTN